MRSRFLSFISAENVSSKSDGSTPTDRACVCVCICVCVCVCVCICVCVCVSIPTVNGGGPSLAALISRLYHCLHNYFCITGSLFSAEELALLFDRTEASKKTLAAMLGGERNVAYDWMNHLSIKRETREHLGLGLSSRMFIVSYLFICLHRDLDLYNATYLLYFILYYLFKIRQFKTIMIIMYNVHNRLIYGNNPVFKKNS